MTTTLEQQKAEAASKMIRATLHPAIVTMLAKPKLSTTEQALLDALEAAVEYGLVLAKEITELKAPKPEVSHHISCASRRHRCSGETECNCTPVAYEPATKTRANLPPFSQQPGPDPTYTEWTLQMWPRRSNVDHFEVTVVAPSADEALSRALSLYPGHAWEGLTDTGRPVRRLGDSPQA